MKVTSEGIDTMGEIRGYIGVGELGSQLGVLVVENREGDPVPVLFEPVGEARMTLLTPRQRVLVVARPRRWADGDVPFVFLGTVESYAYSSMAYVTIGTVIEANGAQPNMLRDFEALADQIYVKVGAFDSQEE